MILSVSRRTDIPAFYSDWFFNRIKAGFVDVRNPMNIHSVSRIELSPKTIDCIVFWTKNPEPMLKRLNELEEYKYYFQFTINPYDNALEIDVPKKNGIINTFKELSCKINSNRVVWRYDPILISDKITKEYHIYYFEELAKRLAGYTSICVISFIDLYSKIKRNLKDLSIREPDELEIKELAKELSLIARKYNIKLQSCAEAVDLSEHGVEHGKCIDELLIKNIVGYSLEVSKDKNQRKECGCVQSIDIGEYNTCLHKCGYCYANFNNQVVSKKHYLHDQDSSLLIGKLQEDDVVKNKEMRLLKPNLLFDF